MHFQLEKYHGAKSRFTCPACGVKRVFVRYLKTDTGEYIAADVGRCNRESNCGYHFTPKEFFIDNPTADVKKPTTRRKSLNYGLADKPAQIIEVQKPTDYIDFEVLKKTLTNYENNSFVQFLLNLFPDDHREVWQTVKDYFLGTTQTGKTVFWQIDQKRRIRTGKIIIYDRETGKRGKKLNWIHSVLKNLGKLNEDFNLSQCFFGEHLLRPENDLPLAIVEAEKTAVIASICFPRTLWIAAGAKQNLRAEKLIKFKTRKIILYPDADAFSQWQSIAADAQRFGLTVKVSSLIENQATDAEKRDGSDLADYLIREQTAIKVQNRFADKYNAALDKVLRDENLFRELNRRLDTATANMILHGGISKSEAETKVFDFENIRQTVLQIAERQNLK